MPLAWEEPDCHAVDCTDGVDPVYNPSVRNKGHGSGRFAPEELAACGEDCVFEPDVLIFHPERV